MQGAALSDKQLNVVAAKSFPLPDPVNKSILTLHLPKLEVLQARICHYTALNPLASSSVQIVPAYGEQYQRLQSA